MAIAVDGDEDVFVPTTKTAAELKHLIQVRIDALEDIEEDGERVFAHDVDWQAPDDSGCNWNMNGYRGPINYATEIRMLVDALRREYQLSVDAMLDGSADSHWACIETHCRPK